MTEESLTPLSKWKWRSNSKRVWSQNCDIHILSRKLPRSVTNPEQQQLQIQTLLSVRSLHLPKQTSRRKKFTGFTCIWNTKKKKKNPKMQCHHICLSGTGLDIPDVIFVNSGCYVSLKNNLLLTRRLACKYKEVNKWLSFQEMISHIIDTVWWCMSVNTHHTHFIYIYNADTDICNLICSGYSTVLNRGVKFLKNIMKIRKLFC